MAVAAVALVAALFVSSRDKPKSPDNEAVQPVAKPADAPRTVLDPGRPGGLDAGFDPGAGPDKQVELMMLDGRGGIFIGGPFRKFGAVDRRGLARLNPDGSLDKGFNPGAGPRESDPYIRAILPLSNGELLVGGGFDDFGDGKGQFRYTRLNLDGSVNEHFKVPAQVRHPGWCFEWDDHGQLFAGGGGWTGFRTPHKGLAKMSALGRFLSKYDPGNGVAKSFGLRALLRQQNGRLLAAGGFRSFSGAAVTNLVRLNPDGSRDTSLSRFHGSDGAITSVAERSDGRLLIAGGFTIASGLNKGRIAQLWPNGELDADFAAGVGFDGPVDQIELLANGKILAVGDFTSFDGRPRNRIARLNKDGSLDESFHPGQGANARIRAMTVQADGHILIAGHFSEYDGVARNGVARVNGGGTGFTQAPRHGRNYEIPGLALKLVQIYAGSFAMGSKPSANDEEKEREPIEEPVTTMRLTKPFWIGKYEVTQGEYEAVMGVNPSQFKGDRNLPVDTVTYHDAIEFCRKLTERERKAGRLPFGYEYGLPTEPQWEYTCRALTDTEYSFGDAITLKQANVLEAFPGDDSGAKGPDKPMPVGTYPPNYWGVHDMHGNVWEWTHDLFSNYPGGEYEDFNGPAEGNARTYRGGCWQWNGKFARTARRGFLDPEDKRNDIGFRVALRPIIRGYRQFHSFDFKPLDAWQRTGYRVSKNNNVLIEIEGEYVAPDGKTYGPTGKAGAIKEHAPLDPKNPEPAFGSFADQTTHYSVSGKIGDSKVRFFVGQKCIFKAYTDGEIQLRVIHGHKDWKGQTKTLKVRITEAPEFFYNDREDGHFTIGGMVALASNLHITPKGMHWTHTAEHLPISLYGEVRPVMINGAYWWPHWKHKRKSSNVPWNRVFPPPGKKLKLLTTAGRGQCKIVKESPEEIVIEFRDNASGPSSLHARFAHE